MGIITLKGINKVYGRGEGQTEALKNIDLTIEKGEMVAIMGPSGCGKTTLLNILGLLDVATSGEYHLCSEHVKGIKAEKLSKTRNERLGFVFQNFNLLNSYTVLENVKLPLMYSKSKKNSKEKALDIIEKVGILDHKDKCPTELSGGQKQRVAIARALINNPDIILADEPTGALDKKTGEDILALLKELNNNGQTIIIVTHDMEIAKGCKRMIKMRDGQIEK